MWVQNLLCGFLSINKINDNSEIIGNTRNNTFSEVSEFWLNERRISNELFSIDDTNNNFCRVLTNQNLENNSERDSISVITTKCNCPTVVIVDDMDHIHSVMKRQLLKLGISSYDCYSGEEVIECMKSYKRKPCCRGIGLIFLDAHMEPGISGIKTAEILKELISKKPIINIPIIMLSADAITNCVSDGFEIKPLAQERLKEILQQYLIYP